MPRNSNDVSRTRYDDWSYWNDKAFIDLVKKYYVKRESIGNDPIIGFRVDIWEPKHDKIAKKKGRGHGG
jgi:hypothetical protein